MSISAQSRVEFPTRQEWDRAQGAMQEAIEAVLAVLSKVERIAEFNGVRAPTLEDIGLVHAHGIQLSSRLDELTGYVRRLPESLHDLDYVRLLGNVPDDGGNDG